MNRLLYIKNLALPGLLYFFFFAFCISCISNEKRTEKKYLIAAIEKLDMNDSTRWVVILPGLGCHGCIREGEAFMKDHIINGKIIFVLTKISSLKILQHKIGITIKNHPNIYVDNENNFEVPTDNTIYPCIVKINKRKLVAFEFQCPDNGQAFRKLKQQIKAEESNDET